MSKQSSTILDPLDLAHTGNLEILTSQIVDGFLSGRHRSKLKGGCAEFAEHRAYYPGDEVRLLDWRALAKSDRYYIKQFEEDTSVQAIFILDGSGSMAFSMSAPSKFAFSRAACLCLARLILHQGDAAGLAISGESGAFVPARAKAVHLEVLINELARFEPNGASSLADDLREVATRIRRRGLVMIFSDCFDNLKDLGVVLKLLRSRRHETILFHVMAPEELSFTFDDPQSRFESLEVNGQRLDLDPISIRPAYLARVKSFLDELRNVCGDAACEYVPLTTDQPIGPALADYLRRRAAGKARR